MAIIEQFLFIFDLVMSGCVITKFNVIYKNLTNNQQVIKVGNPNCNSEYHNLHLQIKLDIIFFYDEWRNAGASCRTPTPSTSPSTTIMELQNHKNIPMVSVGDFKYSE